MTAMSLGRLTRGAPHLPGHPLDSRNNSLNLIHLLLASMVLFAHG
jgi:hypothetical protein